jgi:formate dehydrogenase iron-sulfur subunit
MQACPFMIPKFNYDSPSPKIHKCTFCSDRLEANLEPACAKVCPTDAIEFGDRDVMLAEAKRRIAEAPGRYVPEIYGEKEVGGTNVFHLSSVPFEQIGYETGLPNEPLPNLTHKSMRFVPRIFFTLLGVFGLLAWVVKRRNERLGIAENH